jgi:hypothetical protein
MARGLAIRSITTNQNGSIEVGFSGGSPTAPLGQSGSVIYQSEEFMKDAIKDFETGLTDAQLVALHLAITYLKNDGTFNNVNQVTNKELRLDVFAAQPLRIV